MFAGFLIQRSFLALQRFAEILSVHQVFSQFYNLQDNLPESLWVGFQVTLSHLCLLK